MNRNELIEIKLILMKKVFISVRFDEQHYLVIIVFREAQYLATFVTLICNTRYLRNKIL